MSIHWSNKQKRVMKFTAFKEQNMLLGAGDSPNTSDIPACRAKDPDTGMDFIFGKMQFTDEEIAIIVKNKTLWIGTMGGWPPMLPTVHNPFKDYENNFIPYEI